MNHLTEETKWLCEHARLLEKFSGKWVMFGVNEGVVSNGAILENVLRAGKGKIHEKPFVFHVPSKDELNSPVPFCSVAPQTRLKKNQQISHYEFPYVRFHGKHYPLIPLTLRRGKYSVNTFALLDSGASISVFRPEISKALHMPTKHRAAAHLGTANGGVDIGISRVEIQVESTRFQSKVGFSENFVTSFNILGREGFFHKFSVCFNEMMKTVIMVPLEDM